MHNGSEDFENSGDDKRSIDGSFTNHVEQGLESDQEQSHSNSEEVVSNENDITEGNFDDEDDENGECKEVDQTDQNEQVLDFFKLLPYMYLLQKNLGAGGAPLTPIFELSNSQLDPNSTNNNIMQSSSGLSPSSESYQNLHNLRYLQHLIPNMLHNYKGINFNDLEISNNPVESDEDAQMDDSTDHDEPLDLTQKSKTIIRIKDEKPLRLNQRSERGYTTQDLEAALHDIQSGKLGTRRAAVLYGIPRSTLRNKVYKLGGRNNSALKSPELYANGNEEGDCEYGFINQTATKQSNSRHFPNLIGINNGSNLGNDEGGIHPRRYCSDKPNSLLRIDTLEPNQGRLPDGLNNVQRNQLLFMGGGRGYSQRGRHGSSPSLSLHNYPRVQDPDQETSYDNYADSSLGKKSRPKRGKYRNYDREALARAVQAVQNGEMSVHRAGSYFGVPHSTLEYKVKERHLLRQAKFKGKSTTKSSINKVEVSSLSPNATVDSNDSSNFQKTVPDLGISLSHLLSLRQSLGEENGWKSSDELLKVGLKEANATSEASKKEINDALPKIYDSNESLESNNPSDLLDLTSRT